jgi:hypothetical protein
VDGRQLADFSLVDQPTIGLGLGGFWLPELEQAASIGRHSHGTLCPWDLTPRRRHMTQTGLHALSWGLQSWDSHSR